MLSVINFINSSKSLVLMLKVLCVSDEDIFYHPLPNRTGGRRHMCEGLIIPLLRPSSAHKFQCSLPFKDLPGFYMSERADEALCTADRVRVTCILLFDLFGSTEGSGDCSLRTQSSLFLICHNSVIVSDD